MNILIIEDDLFLGGKIRDIFEKKILSNRVKIISTFDSFLNEFGIINSYDVILLDIILGEKSEKNGIDILKLIRKKNSKIPIVIISSFSELNRLQISFENGASDYIIKPFRLKELELRILKWFKQYLCLIFFDTSNIISYEFLNYDISKNEFYYKNNLIILTKKNKYLLLTFMSNKEKLLYNKYLIEKIWGDIFFIVDRNLRVSIKRLKEALKVHKIDSWITNIRGEGYIFQKN